MGNWGFNPIGVIILFMIGRSPSCRNFLGVLDHVVFLHPPKKEEKNMIWLNCNLYFIRVQSLDVFGLEKKDNQVLKYPKNADVPHSERIDFVESWLSIGLGIHFDANVFNTRS